MKYELILCLLGAGIGIFAMLVTIFSDLSFVVMIFAGGALFGKGYALWENKDAEDL